MSLNINYVEELKDLVYHEFNVSYFEDYGGQEGFNNNICKAINLTRFINDDTETNRTLIKMVLLSKYLNEDNFNKVNEINRNSNNFDYLKSQITILEIERIEKMNEGLEKMNEIIKKMQK